MNWSCRPRRYPMNLPHSSPASYSFSLLLFIFLWSFSSSPFNLCLPGSTSEPRFSLKFNFENISFRFGFLDIILPPILCLKPWPHCPALHYPALHYPAPLPSPLLHTVLPHCPVQWVVMAKLKSQVGRPRCIYGDSRVTRNITVSILRSGPAPMHYWCILEAVMTQWFWTQIGKIVGLKKVAVKPELVL